MRGCLADGQVWVSSARGPCPVAQSTELGSGLVQEVGGGEPHRGVVALPDLVALGVDEDEPVSGDSGVHAGPEGAVGLGDRAVVEQVGGGGAVALHVEADLLGGVHDDRQDRDVGLGEAWLLLDLGHLHGARGAAGSLVEAEDDRFPAELGQGYGGPGRGGQGEVRGAASLLGAGRSGGGQGVDGGRDHREERADPQDPPAAGLARGCLGPGLLLGVLVPESVLGAEGRAGHLGSPSVSWLAWQAGASAGVSGSAGCGARVRRSRRVKSTNTPATARRPAPRRGSGRGLSQSCTRPSVVASQLPMALCTAPPPVISGLPARVMTQMPMTAKAIATARLTVLVTSVRAPRRILMSRAWKRRRSPSRALSQTRAMTKRGKTIPKTNARPRATPPAADPESTDRVMTPARTGAQQLEAIPEKTPRAKKLAPSPRLVSGARMKRGRDHMVPERDSPARAIISRPPAQ